MIFWRTIDRKVLANWYLMRGTCKIVKFTTVTRACEVNMQPLHDTL